ncbi:MAG: nucleotidyltransferase family protein [Anaerolineae bacterium]
MNLQIKVDREAIAEFCREHHIVRLAFFGSVTREDFAPESDVDVLVEFAPEHLPSLIGLARMEIELSPLLQGRKADMRTAEDLSHFFRDRVVAEATVQYEAA